MNVRRPDQPPAPAPAAVPSTPAAKPTAAPTGAAPVAASKFEGTKATAQAAAALGTLPAASTTLPSVSMGNAPGPVELDSAEGKKAIEATYAYLNQGSSSAVALTGRGAGGQAFTPAQVSRDELGMTHVRMNREFNGIPVFGQQVISHLDASGKVADLTDYNSAIPANLNTTPKITGEQATKTALKEFGLKPQNTPEPKLTVYQAQDGQYHTAYQVQLKNLTDGKPQNMNYLVDAQSGKVLSKFNTIDGIEIPKKGAAAQTTVEGANETDVKLKGKGSVTSSITLGDDVKANKVTVDLDLSHNSKSGLSVTLTSPSGKTVNVPVKQGKSVQTTIDLTKSFPGESSKGTWKLTVNDSTKSDTGKLNRWALHVSGDAKTTPPPGPGPGTDPVPGTADDTTLYAGKVDVGATKNADGTYTLKDGTRGKGIVTKDAHNQEDASGATDFKDKNNVWGESTDDARQKGAVDAQYGAEMTYDFYKNVLGRDSIDGKGEALVNNVHISQDYVNAYWDGTEMNYGDGDGVDAGPLTGLDIAGHEITHGMTERTAGLVYEGESGGLNEAMSDIFGKGVEWYASQKNPAVKFTWGVGESVWTPGTKGDALRYMNDPTKDNYSVDNYKNYPKQTEVHGSSGIANNAFTLMVDGGKNKTSGLGVAQGIGMEKALKIMYRAETTYFTPNTTFKQAAAASVKAATDLYGANSPEVKATTDAWKAVGCL